MYISFLREKLIVKPQTIDKMEKNNKWNIEERAYYLWFLK